MFEGSKTPLNLYVEIWILQILMSPNLNFRYQQTVYTLRALKDPYGGLQNPYFLELQQKNVAAGENCPYECAKSTVLARMASGRYRTEALCRYWSDNKGAHCRAPTCYQTPGTIEHLLTNCPALDIVRERLFTMWLEKSVM